MHPAGRRGELASLVGLFGEARRLLRSSLSLRHSLFICLGVGLVLIETFTVPVAWLHDPSSIPWFALAALGWWAVVALFVVGGAPLLRGPDGRRVHRYGVPNVLSAVRAWACLPLMLYASLSLPGRLGLYLWSSVGGAAGMLDYVDGWIARRFGPVTELGKAIDPAMDALFFIVAGIGNYLVGIVPGWLGGLIVARYGGPLLATPIVFLTGRRPQLVHTLWGRRNTAATGVVLFVLLWVRLFDGPVGVVAPAVALPLLVPTLALHMVALVKRTREAPVRR